MRKTMNWMLLVCVAGLAWGCVEDDAGPEENLDEEFVRGPGDLKPNKADRVVRNAGKKIDGGLFKKSIFRKGNTKELGDQIRGAAMAAIVNMQTDGFKDNTLIYNVDIKAGGSTLTPVENGAGAKENLSCFFQDSFMSDDRGTGFLGLGGKQEGAMTYLCAEKRSLEFDPEKTAAFDDSNGCELPEGGVQVERTNLKVLLVDNPESFEPTAGLVHTLTIDAWRPTMGQECYAIGGRELLDEKGNRLSDGTACYWSSCHEEWGKKKTREGIEHALDKLYAQLRTELFGIYKEADVEGNGLVSPALSIFHIILLLPALMGAT